MKFLRPLLIILLVLVVDQTLKFWVKLHLPITDSIKVTPWFYLYFIENEGMAFGMKWGGEGGKLLLTLFRIAAVSFFSYWLWNLVKKNASVGLIFSVSLIIAGAMGNIIDSVFYGVIFSESHPGGSVAQLFPPGGGYGSWLHGRVVDMLYFPLVDGTFPQWVPLWGGEYFIFFRPIFNVADFSISTGVIAILIFQKRFFRKEEHNDEVSSIATVSTPMNEEQIQENRSE